MTCDNCKNQNAHRIQCSKEGMVCDRCGKLGGLYVPDVFFERPYLDPNLGHPSRPHEANGVWVESKRHKQALLNEQGLCERGDKKHGMRNYDKHLQSSGER